MEDDYGLWEGQPPTQAIATQVAFTYGNAIYDAWRELIDTINNEYQDLTPR